jgi:hypothetical protein
MGTKTEAGSTYRKHTARSGEWTARVTGRVLNAVLADWDAHDDTCRPSDHPDRRDSVACARGEHR